MHSTSSLRRQRDLLRASLWSTLQATDDGLLDDTLGVLEAECAPSGGGAGGERAAAAMRLFAVLAAHSLHPNQLRRLLALHTATGEGALLHALTQAISRTASEPLGTPRRFFAFNGVHPPAPQPPLQGECFGRDAFVIWFWLRLDSVCSFLATAGHGVEVSLRGGLLTVVAMSPKGGAASAQVPAPLSAGEWHWALRQRFVFPAPTKDLRHWSVGGPLPPGVTAHESTCAPLSGAQLAELLLLPAAAAGSAAVSGACAALSASRARSLEEASATAAGALRLFRLCVCGSECEARQASDEGPVGSSACSPA
ncbi:hypothetical protein EMIHUDRAFT_248406 [Emiliania huxleyi CCMP1516]|uniref:TLDc domain-containing protein n=2 Tax=Emiliania huxleyi TaxID=2903 RepID=A0A0D3IGH6_EMIH1|nr:hypothetical protein EMIHUDRAFT_248406 [Emiliania huxleyi CCMP1516]EOD10361.1 hypothetical protein EMIHUDRAFT_248406 [Emiliania huxleyi CCMP1516]|eukprot:XP_005762790.1 hypothetical protein EMIHUDRAFT_248406 [Emiliania huxleyi CCMP1516]